MKQLLYILLLFLPLHISAQTIISGVIRYSDNSKPVDGVNVMLQDTTQRFMYGFSLTNAEGSYSIECKQKINHLIIAVSGFNIKATQKIIENHTQQIDLLVETSALKIREVTVKADPITRQSDTLTYVVESFKSVADKSIGDVIKKMPGIEVESSGQINYNGKAINKFYIEGMDMLEGRYGVATNNVQAKDIASVQVFENHQPIKALSDLVKTDQAALNLKLKENAKGTWNGTLQLGAGYKPMMWNAEATAMSFGRKFQTISTYKTNNSGDDVSSELISFFDGMSSASSIIGISIPSLPSLNKNRYLDNNVHSVSINTINKFSDDVEFTTNSKYTHDTQKSKGSSSTTYYLPNEDPFSVTELTSATQQSDNVEVALQLRKNSKQQYLREKLTLSGEWLNDLGQVVSDDDIVGQTFEMPKLSAKNNISLIQRFGNYSVNFNSDTEYSSQSALLAVSPMLYPEVFGSPEGYPDAIQSLDDRTFTTNNRAYASLTHKNWSFFLNVGANAEIKNMESELAATSSDGASLGSIDSMRNEIYWRKLTLSVSPSVTYDLGDALNLSLAFPLNFVNLHTEDRINVESVGDNMLLLSPSLRAQSNLTYNLKLSAGASYSENMGDLYDNYNGYIMSNYRTIASKDGDLSHSATQYYNASLSYGDAILALFGSLNASYSHTERNLLYGTTYDGSLLTIDSYAIDHAADYYSLSASASKRIDGIATTVSVKGGYIQSLSEMLVQSELQDYRYDNLSAGFGINTRFTRKITLDYAAAYSQSTSYIDGITLTPIDVFTQDAALNFTIKEKTICRIAGEHYYNAAIGGDDANMFFLDASLRYSTKKVEYSIEARNLLNTKTFSNATQSSNYDYRYSYSLRPCSVMFKVKFSLK